MYFFQFLFLSFCAFAFLVLFLYRSMFLQHFHFVPKCSNQLLLIELFILVLLHYTSALNIFSHHNSCAYCAVVANMYAFSYHHVSSNPAMLSDNSLLTGITLTFYRLSHVFHHMIVVIHVTV